MADSDDSTRGTIVVLGATGYTGRLAVDALLRRGIRPVVAGRKVDHISQVARDLGDLEARVADASDPDSVRQLVSSGDVLLTTVGPFDLFGHGVAEAAASAGAHYVDSTGEIGFIREVTRRWDSLARETGSTMVPAFGYDYVPGILAGALALAEAPEATALRVGYFATGDPLWKGLSQGTRTTVAEGLTLPTTVWRNGRFTDVRMAAGVASFPVHGRPRKGFLVSGSEVLYFPPAHPALQTVEVFNGWFPGLSRAVQGATKLANAVARNDAGAKVVKRASRVIVGPAGGPDLAERARTRTHVVALAQGGGDRTLAEVHVEGPSIYSLTGELLALASDLLASGASREAGVLGPIEAFGLDTLESTCAAVGLQRTPV
ncbi:MAG: saccharopine dehydrogenase family protein [Actinomycetales bacterium]